MALSGDQFLPGMESLRPAEAHEQTAAQFHNRPDVFVHGRYEHTLPGSRELDLHEDNFRAFGGFHVGTEQSAHERLEQGHGVPWADTHPRFYHGKVDPKQMLNTAQAGRWESSEGHLGGMVRHADDPGRLPDQSEEWRPKDHGKYYRNDYEDKGSTSAVLPTTVQGENGRATYVPQNFLTHRQAVSQALKSGQRVPGHVRSWYAATGGEAGPKSVVHPHFRTPTTANKHDDPFDVFPEMFQHSPF